MFTEDSSPYLLDYEGNPVEYDKIYYMDPYYYLRRGLTYETYLGEQFVLLQNEEDSTGSFGSQPIKFTRYIEDHTDQYVALNDWSIIRAVNPPEAIEKKLFTYSNNPLAHGIKLTGLPMVPLYQMIFKSGLQKDFLKN